MESDSQGGELGWTERVYCAGTVKCKSTILSKVRFGKKKKTLVNTDDVWELTVDIFLH